MVHLRGECLTVTDPIVGEIIAITLRSRQWRGRALFGIALYRYDSEISQVMDIIDQLINSDDAMESFLSLSG